MERRKKRDRELDQQLKGRNITIILETSMVIINRLSINVAKKILMSLGLLTLMKALPNFEANIQVGDNHRFGMNL